MARSREKSERPSQRRRKRNPSEKSAPARRPPARSIRKLRTNSVGPSHEKSSQLKSPQSKPPQLETLQEIEGVYRLVVDSLKDCAIYALDCDGYVTSWNPGAENILGYAPDEILGRHYSCFFPPEDIASEKPIRELQKAVSDGELETEGWRIRKDGSRFWSDVILSSLRDDQGSLIGFAKVTRDTTERRNTSEELRNRQALLSQAEVLANMGSWEIDAAAFTVTWSDHFFRMLHLEAPASPAPLREVARMVTLENPGECRTSVLNAIQNRQMLDRTDRYHAPDGQIRVLHSRGIPIVDSSGRTVRLIGTTQDITDREIVATKLRQSEALLAQAETLANLGSWELDLNTGAVDWSVQIYRILGLNQVQTTPTIEVLSQLLGPEHRQMILHRNLRRMTNRASLDAEVHWPLPDGTEKILYTRVVPIYGESGEAVRLIGTTEDISERVRREVELQRLSQQLLSVRDEERRRVARELHESVAQGLASMKLLLGNAADLVPKTNARARRVIHSAAEIAEETIGEVRTISHLLHPPLLDEMGLNAAVRWYARGFAERSGIPTAVEMDEEFGRLPRETELAVFRIVQEALTNVHRHSGSPDAIIRISREAGIVRVEVEDHGRGMSRSSKATGGEVRLGVGTAGMRERVTQLSGFFEIRSTPGEGTTVCATLPLPLILPRTQSETENCNKEAPL